MPVPRLRIVGGGAVHEAAGRFGRATAAGVSVQTIVDLLVAPATSLMPGAAAATPVVLPGTDAYPLAANRSVVAAATCNGQTLTRGVRRSQCRPSQHCAVATSQAARVASSGDKRS